MFISQALAASDKVAKDSGGAFPPFDPTYFASQILWLAVTFGFFYVFMSRVAIPRIAGILEVRKDRISRDLDETRRLGAEADAACSAYEHELAEARRNAHAIALEATEKAKDEAAKAREKVETELAEKMAKAEAHIASIMDQALSEIDTIATDTAQEIVQQLIGGKPTRTEVANAVMETGK